MKNSKIISVSTKNVEKHYVRRDLVNENVKRDVSKSHHIQLSQQTMNVIYLP